MYTSIAQKQVNANCDFFKCEHFVALQFYLRKLTEGTNQECELLAVRIVVTISFMITP